MVALMVHNAELIASFWTLSGELTISDPGPSKVSLQERAAAAVAAGYAGLGVDYRDVAEFRAGQGIERMASILADTGVTIVEVELLSGWADPPDSADPSVRERQRQVRAELFEAAGELGARHVKAGAGFVETKVSTEQIAEAFAQLCGDADAVGTSVVLELLPNGPIRTLDRAAAVVTAAGAANGGLLLDAWHVDRAGVDLAAIATLPPGILCYVELCDGLAASGVPPLVDATSNRMLCGEGQFDLEGLLFAVRACGYDGPYGVEVLSASLRHRPVTEVAEITSASAVRLLRGDS